MYMISFHAVTIEVYNVINFDLLFQDDTYTESYISTIGVDFVSTSFNNTICLFMFILLEDLDRKVCQLQNHIA